MSMLTHKTGILRGFLFLSSVICLSLDGYTQRLDEISTIDSNSSSKDVREFVAFGTQSKVKVVASVASVSGNELFRIPTVSTSNTLQGKIPGLTAILQPGEPGLNPSDLYIRGLSTYNNNSISIYVDGFESTFDHLSALEIDRLTILKDAASLALFGMQVSNGVLLVIT